MDVEAADVLQIFELLLQRKLGLAESPISEVNRNFYRSNTTALDQELQADLIADRIEAPPACERRSLESEKSAHWILEARQRHRQHRRDSAIDPPEQAPIVVSRSTFGEP